MRKKLFIAAAIGCTLLTAMPAAATVFTTDDGVLSIETPDPTEENPTIWIQTADSNHWFTITDGQNTINIDHLGNGESLPQVQVADSNYAGVFHAFASTRDEVFIVRGLAEEVENLEELMKVIGTVKVLKYGTKTAVNNTAQTEASEFGLREINATYYAIADDVNVRSDYSMDSSVLGSLNRGDAVTVKGAVLRNGTDYGWYKIDYNGRDAYVSAGFLSDKKPESSSSTTTEKYPVSNGFAVYDSNGSLQGLLVKYSDGYYYSNDMQPYRDNGDGSYYGVNTGDTLYNTNSGTSPTQGLIKVWDGNGNVQGYLEPPTNDGYYYSNDGQPYQNNGDGSYYGVNTGDTLYDYYPGNSASNNTDDSSSGAWRTLCEQDSGEVVSVSAGSYDSYVWYDGNGVEYQDNGDGTFTDYYGNHYDVIG